MSSDARPPDSKIDEARLSVMLDLRHPLAYLALHPTIALGRDFALDINWLPVRVPPLRAPSSPGPDDDRGLRHRRHRAQAIAREIDVYAAAQGLVLREFYRDADPTAAYAGWLWLREHQPERLVDYLAAVFRDYWALELDPASPEATARLIARLGLDARAFEAWFLEHGSAREAALSRELLAHGVAGAPCYVVDGEVFLGRQHLPMIRWILEGRSGPGPI